MNININNLKILNNFNISPIFINNKYYFNIKNNFFKNYINKIFFLNQNFKKINIFQTNFINILSNCIFLSFFFKYNSKELNRLSILNDTQIIISNCLFENCKNFNNNGFESNGGAIFCHYGFLPNSFIILKYTNFYNCSSKISGGAFYFDSYLTKIEYICCYSCLSQTNQAYFSYGINLNINYSLIFNNFNFELSSIIIGLSGDQIKIFYQNITNNKINGDFGILFCNQFEYFLQNYCIFNNCSGNNGFYFNGDLINIYHSDISFNNILKGYLFYTKGQLNLLNCGLLLLNSFIISQNFNYLISFKNCFFDYSEIKLGQIIDLDKLINGNNNIINKLLILNFYNCKFNETFILNTNYNNFLINNYYFTPILTFFLILIYLKKILKININIPNALI